MQAVTNPVIYAPNGREVNSCKICGLRAELPLDGWIVLYITLTGPLKTWIANTIPPGYALGRVKEIEFACGQHHALILTERWLERGTFESVDFNLPVPVSIGDALEELT